MLYSLVQPTGRCFQVYRFYLDGLSKIIRYVENNNETHRSMHCSKVTEKQVGFTAMSI